MYLRGSRSSLIIIILTASFFLISSLFPIRILIMDTLPFPQTAAIINGVCDYYHLKYSVHCHSETNSSIIEI